MYTYAVPTQIIKGASIESLGDHADDVWKDRDILKKIVVDLPGKTWRDVDLTHRLNLRDLNDEWTDLVSNSSLFSTEYSLSESPSPLSVGLLPFLYHLPLSLHACASSLSLSLSYNFTSVEESPVSIQLSDSTNGSSDDISSYLPEFF